MHLSKEEQISHHKALLDDPNDIKLFTNGGCGVFALTLHLKFDYKVRYIPGHDEGRISHVYCQLVSDGNFAVDVAGTKAEGERVYKDFGGLCAPSITEQQLRAFFRPAGEIGLFGESWFIDAATKRANNHIEKYIPHFDGTQKCHIPGI